VQDPGRLARRYLIRGPRVFLLLHDTDVSVRPHAITHRAATSAAGGTRPSASL